MKTRIYATPAVKGLTPGAVQELCSAQRGEGVKAALRAVVITALKRGRGPKSIKKSVT